MGSIASGIDNNEEKEPSRQKRRVDRNKETYKRREDRKNNRAERLAAKKGFKDKTDTKTGKVTTAEQQGRALMSERRQKGRDFFINMAKAAGSGDTYTPKKRRTAAEGFAELGEARKQAASLEEDVEKQTGTGSKNTIGSLAEYNESVRVGDPGTGPRFTAAVNASKAIEGQNIDLTSMGNENKDRENSDFNNMSKS